MKRLAKLGDVEITVVEDENPIDSVTITNNSVESGQDVSDHIKQEPSIINITGVFTGDDAAKKLEKLKRYMYEGKLLHYICRNSYKSMAIESINRNHNGTIANGFRYNIVLKRVRIATAKEVELNIVDPSTGKASPKLTAKVKPITNHGKQQVQKKTTSGGVQVTKSAYPTKNG